MDVLNDVTLSLNQIGRVERMKKFVRWVLVSALALISFGSFSQTVDAAGASGNDYIHTFETTKLYSMKPGSGKNGQYHEFTEVTNRALSANTDWYTDQMVSSPERSRGFQRVATNEWVKSSDIIYINKTDRYTKMDLNEEMSIFSFDFDSYKAKQTGKVLPKGQWLMGTTIAYPYGISYMRVGGNEWVEMTEG